MSVRSRLAFAFSNVAASTTDASLIVGTSGLRIVVYGVACLAGGTATNVTFNTATGGSNGVAISMLFANAANGGFVLPYSEVGWFSTLAGDYLTCTTGAGSTTGVQVTYGFEL
jgi:hypothetical protein